MNDENREKFLKGIAQNGCLLLHLCCPEGLTPFPELSVVLFLNLEWKPEFPPPLQNAAQAELLPTASTYPGLPNTHFWSSWFGY